MLFGVLNAAEPESTLTQVVVNGTDETGNSTSACLRAEFTAEFVLSGTTFGIPAMGNSDVDSGFLHDCGILSLSGKIKNQNQTTNYTLFMQFKEIKNEEENGKDSWEMLTIKLTVSNDVYQNSSVSFIAAPLVGKYGQSFLCTAGFDIILPKSDGEGSTLLTLGRLQLQPFRVPEDTFANPIICSQDISVVVPAIVGSILGLLVIIVLITYIIGRRRTRIAYQEI